MDQNLYKLAIRVTRSSDIRLHSLTVQEVGDGQAGQARTRRKLHTLRSLDPVIVGEAHRYYCRR